MGVPDDLEHADLLECFGPKGPLLEDGGSSRLLTP